MSGIITLAHFGMTCFVILAGSYCIRGKLLCSNYINEMCQNPLRLYKMTE